MCYEDAKKSSPSLLHASRRNFVFLCPSEYSVIKIASSHFEGIGHWAVAEVVTLWQSGKWKVGSEHRTLNFQLRTIRIQNAFYLNKGTPISITDVFIAATALAHRFTIVTNNTKDFRRIQGLTLEDWR